MSSQSEALLFLDMDKGKAPQLDEQRALVRKDERLRAGWFQFQALQALALESAPEPSEKMVQTVLAQCRRDHVSRQLAQLTGGDDLAREILLGKIPQSRAPIGWILGLLLVGALGLGWTQYQGENLSTLFRTMGSPAANPSPVAAANPLPGGADAVPFEFPVQTPPVEAALSQPGDDASNSDADDVHGESSASQQARRLLREHLHEAEAREQGSDSDSEASDGDSGSQASAADTDSDSSADAEPAAPPRQSAPVPSPRTEPVAKTAQAAAPAPQTQTTPQTLVDAASAGPPAPLVAAAPALVATPVLAGDAATAPSAEAQSASSTADAGSVIQPGLTLSSDSLVATAGAAGLTASAQASGPAGPLDVALSMPERDDIDVRLFGPDGKSARTLAAGPFGPGTVHFLLNAANDQGQALAPGTYYLRVMTPWFSRVEPIQIH